MTQTLTQTQIIRSLAEALSWFEKELSWGVPPASLSHLTGRIGELYVAMITRGQMALGTHQRGYDVISAENERISVKTVTTSSHVTFNPRSLDQVDRTIVLRVTIDEDRGISIEELFDLSVAELQERAITASDGLRLATNLRPRPILPQDHLSVTDTATFRDLRILRYENGSIRVERDGVPILPAKPVLREIAAEVGVSLEGAGGRIRTTHELGSHVIRALTT